MHCSKFQHDGFRYKETPMTSGLVYQHMSSHYRRILNAKPAVDTSVPQSFKLRQAHSAKPRRRSSPAPTRDTSSVCSHDVFPAAAACSAEQLALIDRIVASDKYSPADVCRLQWSSSRQNSAPVNGNPLKTITNQLPRARPSRPGAGRNSQIMTKSRRSGDVIERHKEQFEAYRLDFWPRILKTDAVSKLRDMRVYHPPRRKTAFEKSEWEENELEEDDGAVEERACGCREKCNCAAAATEPMGKEPSQASSRDSAYNGGTSSTPDSRSPTPCQQKTRSNHVKDAATQTELPTKHSHSRRSSQTRGAKNDFAYTKFIHDITMDVVEKGQFTDKALTKVITKHVTANIAILDKGRMLEEVSKLREQLGMPSTEDTFLSPPPSKVRDVAATAEEMFLSPTPARDVAATSSASSEHSESWTKHYLQLRGPKTLGPSNDSADRSATSCADEETIVSNLVTDEEDDKDSDSSHEATIKEVAQVQSWRAEGESGDEEDLAESIEVGSSVSDEADLSE